MDICGGQALYLPASNCDDCEDMSARLRVIENLLKEKGDVVITKTDVNGNTTTLTLVGAVS